MEIALRCRPRSDPCLVEARVVIELDEVCLHLCACREKVRSEKYVLR